MKRNLDIPESPSASQKAKNSKENPRVNVSKDKSSSSKTSKKDKKSAESNWLIEIFPQQKQTREQLIYLTKLAESCKDWDRMAKFVAEYCKHEPHRELTTEERELLSVAFRHMIRERRHCWRLISKKRAELKKQLKRN